MCYEFPSTPTQIIYLLPSANFQYFRYLGPIDLAQYFVKDISINKHQLRTDYGSSEAIRVDIVFSRRMLGTLLTTYLPTLLLCMVCFATSYFKVQYAQYLMSYENLVLIKSSKKMQYF